MKQILRNWKTTGAGCVALPIIITGILEKNIMKVLEGLGILLVGVNAKDNNKTGLGL